MNWYGIANVYNADPYFMQCCVRQIRDAGAVIEANSAADVVHINDVYAKGHGRLTEKDVIQLGGNALETILQTVGGEK